MERRGRHSIARKKTLFILSAAAASAFAAFGPAYGDSTWNAPGGGSWVNPTNWTGGVPDSAGSVADFGSSILTASTVTLDGDETAGTIVLNNTNAYTIAQGSGGSLIFDDGAGIASVVDQGIVGQSGVQTISAPIELNSSLDAESNSSSLTLAGAISSNVGGTGLMVSGTGTVTISGTNSYSGETTINGGTVEMNSSSSMGSGPTTINGGRLIALNSIKESRNFFVGSAGATVVDGSGAYEIDGTVANTGATAGTLTITEFGGSVLLYGSNTYSGGTVILGADLKVNNPASMGTGPATLEASVLEATNSIVESRNFYLFPETSSAIQVDNGCTYEIDGVIAAVPSNLNGAPTLFVGGSGVLVMAANNTYAEANTSGFPSTYIVSGATLQIGAGGSSGSVAGPISDNGTLNFDRSDNGLTFTSAISGNGTLNMIGTGTITLGTANIILGGINVDAGTLNVAESGYFPSFANNSNLEVNANATTYNVSGNGTTSVSGGQSLTVNANFTQGSLQNYGSTILNGTGTIGHLSGNGLLDITNTSAMQLAAGASGDTQGGLTIDTPNGQLDITDNKLVINYGVGNPSPVKTIGGYITSGFSGATWTGSGIVSSKVAVVNAAHGDSHLYAIGYADASDVAVAVDHFTPGTVVIEPAIVGDANLDGKVNFTDFQLLSANFNDSTSLDSADFSALNNFAERFADSLIANADGTAFIIVPEPASLSLLAIAASGLLSHRRRRIRAAP